MRTADLLFWRDDLDFLHVDPSCRPDVNMRRSHLPLDAAFSLVTEPLGSTSEDFCHVCLPGLNRHACLVIERTVRERDDEWSRALAVPSSGDAFDAALAAAQVAEGAAKVQRVPAKFRGRSLELLTSARERVALLAPSLTSSPGLVLAAARAAFLLGPTTPPSMVVDEAEAQARVLAATPGTVVARVRELRDDSDPVLVLTHRAWCADGVLAGPLAAFDLLSRRALARDPGATHGGRDVVEALTVLARENPTTRVQALVAVAEAF